MKIAFCIRDNYKTRGGGDVIQMLETKKHLQNLDQGISIDIITSSDDITNEYDICHIFNLSLTEDTRKFIKAAKLNRCKVALSTIYWDYTITIYRYFIKVGIATIDEKLLKIQKKIVTLINQFYPISYLSSNKFREEIKIMLREVDIVLPNSEEELEHLQLFLGEKIKNKIKIVFNGTKLNQGNNLPDITEKYNIPKDYILQVGRIEFIKNQLAVVKALFHDKQIPIVFLGKVFEPKYYKKLVNLSKKRGNVYFIDEVDHGDVYSFYKYAKVHVLPSLRESPGLVSLESLAMGCNIVVSQFPYSPYKTYFDKVAFKINPFDIKNLRQGILEAINHPKDREMLKKAVERFSWNSTAVQTLSGYNEIIDSN